MADETSPDAFSELLVAALDTADADPVRLHLMVALALFEAPIITEDERERLRREGLPTVFRL